MVLSDLCGCREVLDLPLQKRDFLVRKSVLSEDFIIFSFLFFVVLFELLVNIFIDHRNIVLGLLFLLY